MSWQAILQETGRIWLVSSWMVALTFIIWIKSDNDLKLQKSKFILILISLSITHAILKTIVPQIAFIFNTLLFILISVFSYKLTIYKALKSIFKLIALMFTTEIFLHILIFKVLGMQRNPNDNIFWFISSALTLSLIIAIKRKEIFKNGYAYLGRTKNEHQKNKA